MDKLKEIINKLLGKDKGSSSEGFTLIELLIVIAVIGILAAALLVAIDPIDKIRAGNDTKVQSDVRSIYDAVNRAYAQTYTLPTTATALEATSEMSNVPTPPSSHGTAYGFYADATTGNVLITGQQLSKKNVAAAGASATAPTYFVASKDGACILDTAPTNPNAASICP